MLTNVARMRAIILSEERALRAMRCSNLSPQAFGRMGKGSIPLTDFVGEQGVQSALTQKKLGELAAEDDLVWLIRVGVLRREVDGQGITDRFRLTPMGISLTLKLRDQEPTLWDWGQDWALRRLSF